MKNTKKKLKGQSRFVKYLFTGNNITKYSGLNTVAKYMNKQGIVKSISTLFSTEWHSAKKRFCLQYLSDDEPKERQV